MGEFKLLKRIAACANGGDQATLSEIIINTDFSDKNRALEVAVNVFLLTKDNVKANKKAAIKLASYHAAEQRWKVEFRLGLLSDLLKEINFVADNCGKDYREVFRS